MPNKLMSFVGCGEVYLASTTLLYRQLKRFKQLSRTQFAVFNLPNESLPWLFGQLFRLSVHFFCLFASSMFINLEIIFLDRFSSRAIFEKDIRALSRAKFRSFSKSER